MSKQQPDIFTRFTSGVATTMGHAWVFITALAVLIVWGLSGPIMGFSDTWQLIINTSTTIVTFLMVFIIQNTQNRDGMAMNIKLDMIMAALDVNEKSIFESEDKSDKTLQRKKKVIQNAQERKKRRSPKNT